MDWILIIIAIAGFIIRRSTKAKQQSEQQRKPLNPPAPGHELSHPEDCEAERVAASRSGKRAAQIEEQRRRREAYQAELRQRLAGRQAQLAQQQQSKQEPPRPKPQPAPALAQVAAQPEPEPVPSMGSSKTVLAAEQAPLDEAYRLRGQKQTLLQGNDLARGLVMAEILSPPLAKRRGRRTI